MTGRILISGTNSGCGKTTVTLAILGALKKRGVRVAAYKCGPDYIDPMFHRKALGIPSYNLDPFFCIGSRLCSLLARCETELCVIEGAMGYYDGMGTEGKASAYEVARETNTPVILTVNAKGMYASAGAVLRGFRQYKENSGICGVIFNRASVMTYNGLSKIAESEGLTPLGFLPCIEKAAIDSRHLGLITADEISDIDEKLALLANRALETIDFDTLTCIAKSAEPLCKTTDGGAPENTPLQSIAVRIAVARDEAFCFIYEENLELLMALGCELCFFSPLHDAHMPSGVNGLYLPGGYPELHIDTLSANTSMRGEIRAAIEGGMPTIAECGGFLYLHDTLDDAPMAGYIHARAYKTLKLNRFGYVELTAKKDNLLCAAGDTIRSHEFHYYESTDCGTDFSANKVSANRRYDCIHATPTLYAGFPHLYFPSNPVFAKRFVDKCAE